MTMRDIAREAGVSYWYIRALACGDERSIPPFPRPYTKIGRSPVWASDTVWRWIEKRELGCV
jgi:hypothetical protein